MANSRAICIVAEAGKTVWQGMVDTHPEIVATALKRCPGKLERVGLETGALAPHLYRELAAQGFAMVCMDARRAADAIESRRIESDKADAWALAEMLRTGWFTEVHVQRCMSSRSTAIVSKRCLCARSARSDRALAWQSDPRPAAPVRHRAAVAGWHQTVCRGGPPGDAERSSDARQHCRTS